MQHIRQKTQTRGVGGWWCNGGAACCLCRAIVIKGGGKGGGGSPLRQMKPSSMHSIAHCFPHIVMLFTLEQSRRARHSLCCKPPAQSL